MEFKRAKSDDLRALDQLCVGKTADQLQAMSRVVRQWRLKVREEKDFFEQRQYRCGEKVSFRDKRGNTITGSVKSVNKRTLSLDHCSDGKRWRVGYGFIEKAT
jgi:hypothetical protein